MDNYMFITLLITPIISGIVQTITSGFSKIITEYITDLTNYILSNYLGYNYVYIEYGVKLDAYNGNINVFPSYKNKEYIQSILKYIIDKHSSILKNYEITFDDQNDNIIFPLNTIYINNIYITYSRRNTKDDKYYGNTDAFASLTLKSKLLNNTEITNFIEKCYKKYNNKPLTDKRNNIYMLKNSGDNNVRFAHFTSNTTKTFESVFHDKKDDIIKYIDKYTNPDNSTKLGLLLYGEPGTGKTSIIKSIINYTKYEAFIIKLNQIRTVNNLIDIVFKENMLLDDGRKRRVSLDNRIYIFEDIDCDTRVIHRDNKTIRSKIDFTNPVFNNEQNFDDQMENKQDSTLTLSDILNVFDGVIELNKCIIIFTTNHVEKLDPALIRPGRITAAIELGKMSRKSMTDMILYYFPDINLNDLDHVIVDNVIVPAKLEIFCQMSKTTEELVLKLEDYLSDSTEVNRSLN